MTDEPTTVSSARVRYAYDHDLSVLLEALRRVARLYNEHIDAHVAQYDIPSYQRAVDRLVTALQTEEKSLAVMREEPRTVEAMLALADAHRCALCQDGETRGACVPCDDCQKLVCSLHRRVMTKPFFGGVAPVVLCETCAFNDALSEIAKREQ